MLGHLLTADGALLRAPLRVVRRPVRLGRNDARVRVGESVVIEGDLVEVGLVGDAGGEGGFLPAVVRAVRSWKIDVAVKKPASTVTFGPIISFSNKTPIDLPKMSEQ